MPGWLEGVIEGTRKWVQGQGALILKEERVLKRPWERPDEDGPVGLDRVEQGKSSIPIPTPEQPGWGLVPQD